MTREEAIKEACAIVGTAYKSIGDYRQPCDCFCSPSSMSYQNTGEVLAYVRKAVIEKLHRDGHTVQEVR